jgi:hypothetical protein
MQSARVIPSGPRRQRKAACAMGAATMSSSRVVTAWATRARASTATEAAQRA